jgi:hypothetical protein
VADPLAVAHAVGVDLPARLGEVVLARPAVDQAVTVVGDDAVVPVAAVHVVLAVAGIDEVLVVPAAHDVGLVGGVVDLPVAPQHVLAAEPA